MFSEPYHSQAHFDAVYMEQHGSKVQCLLQKVHLKKKKKIQLTIQLLCYDRNCTVLSDNVIQFHIIHVGGCKKCNFPLIREHKSMRFSYSLSHYSL